MRANTHRNTHNSKVRSRIVIVVLKNGETRPHLSKSTRIGGKKNYPGRFMGSPIRQGTAVTNVLRWEYPKYIKGREIARMDKVVQTIEIE